MAGFVDFLREVLEQRAKEKNLLVFYDATKGKLFREIFQGIGDLLVLRLDAEKDPIGARVGMAKAVRDGTTNVFLYVPHVAPQTDDEKKEDLWSVYAAIGTPFPSCPAEEYEELACECYPNKREEIHQLFSESQGEPSFTAIDQIGQSSGKWPILQAESGKETREELLRWLLTTEDKESIRNATKDIAGFAEEVLAQSIETRVEPEEVQRTIWERTLITDYLAGFGDQIPARFQTVKVAPELSQAIIRETLATIRRDSKEERKYCDRADSVVQRFKLNQLQEDFSKEGSRNETFRFEERHALKRAVDSLAKLRVAEARKELSYADCVWAQEDGPTLQWGVVKSGVAYLDKANEMKETRRNVSISLKALIDEYARKGYEVDSTIRQFEKAFEECKASPSSVSEETLEDLWNEMEKMRRSLLADYRTISAKRQEAFVSCLLAETWPVAGGLDNARVFDEFVAPKLRQAGNALALIIVDGLRYELGELLAQQMKSFSPKIIPACARMPTITRVGKATLLPGGEEVVFKKDSEELSPVLGGRILLEQEDRTNYLKAVYGERFQEMLTREFLSGKKRLSEKTQLLLLRNDDIDSVLEVNQPGQMGKVQATINELVRTVNKIRQTEKVCFTDIVIASDHGFVLNYAPEESDVCPKPDGVWDVKVHDRMLLGRSKVADPFNVIFPATQLGIHGDFDNVAMPSGLCCYATNRYYFHGGASLEEAIVPVIVVRLETTQETSRKSSGNKVLMRAKRDRFTSVIARIYIANPNGKDEGNRPTSKQVEIVVTRVADRTNKPVGHVSDNEANLVTLDGSEETEVKIRLDEDALFDKENSSEQVVRVLVRALDPSSQMMLGEVKFEVELVR